MTFVNERSQELVKSNARTTIASKNRRQFIMTDVKKKSRVRVVTLLRFAHPFTAPRYRRHFSLSSARTRSNTRDRHYNTSGGAIITRHPAYNDVINISRG